MGVSGFIVVHNFIVKCDPVLVMYLFSKVLVLINESSDEGSFMSRNQCLSGGCLFPRTEQIGVYKHIKGYE